MDCIKSVIGLKVVAISISWKRTCCRICDEAVSYHRCQCSRNL